MSETKDEVWCPKCAALVTAFRFNGGQWRCTGGPHAIEFESSDSEDSQNDSSRGANREVEDE